MRIQVIGKNIKHNRNARRKQEMVKLKTGKLKNRCGIFGKFWQYIKHGNTDVAGKIHVFITLPQHAVKQCGCCPFSFGASDTNKKPLRMIKKKRGGACKQYAACVSFGHFRQAKGNPG